MGYYPAALCLWEVFLWLSVRQKVVPLEGAGRQPDAFPPAWRRHVQLPGFPSLPSPLTSTAIAIALIRSLIFSLRRSAPCCARLDHQEAGLVQDTQATPQLEVETQ